VFGMGTGVTLPTKSPENFSKPVFGFGSLVLVVLRCLIQPAAEVQSTKHKAQRPKSRILENRIVTAALLLFPCGKLRKRDLLLE
jgi:hypothetical protein